MLIAGESLDSGQRRQFVDGFLQSVLVVVGMIQKNRSRNFLGLGTPMPDFVKVGTNHDCLYWHHFLNRKYQIVNAWLRLLLSRVFQY